MLNVKVELRGLVDLVSNGDPHPGQAWLLMPNAEEPGATWIPPWLRFRKVHTARLLIRSGSHAGGVALTMPARCGQHYPGISLMGKQVSLKPQLSDEQGNQGLVIDRGSGDQSVNHVCSMDYLVQHGEGDPGGIDPNLQGAFGDVVVQRLAARHVLTSGVLTASLWSDPMRGPKRVGFQMTPPPMGSSPPLPDVHMAEFLLLTGAIDAHVLTVELKSLATGQSDGELLLAPDGGGNIDLIIENSPEDCFRHDNHFLAHYWLREHPERARRVYTPSAAGWAHGAGSNPQCSPGENQGG